MASTSPYVKTRGERKGGKQKASGNVRPANNVDRPNCESTDGSMAAMEAKLDVIMKRLDKLDVLDQLAAQHDQPVHIGGVLPRQHRRVEGGE